MFIGPQIWINAVSLRYFTQGSIHYHGLLQFYYIDNVMKGYFIITDCYKSHNPGENSFTMYMDYYSFWYSENATEVFFSWITADIAI